MFVTSGRARMAYEITGVNDGADVLLIHAGVNDRRSWQHVISSHPRWAAELRSTSSWPSPTACLG